MLKNNIPKQFNQNALFVASIACVDRIQVPYLPYVHVFEQTGLSASRNHAYIILTPLNPTFI